jgi:hypothetical protein
MRNRSRVLREILVTSRVAAATIAFLLLAAFGGLFEALWSPVYRIAEYVITAILILDIPYHARGLDAREGLAMINSLVYLQSSVVTLIVAWLFSRWVYGVGPLNALRQCAGELRGQQPGVIG